MLKTLSQRDEFFIENLDNIKELFKYSSYSNYKINSFFALLKNVSNFLNKEEDLLSPSEIMDMAGTPLKNPIENMVSKLFYSYHDIFEPMFEKKCFEIVLFKNLYKEVCKKVEKTEIKIIPKTEKELNDLLTQIPKENLFEYMGSTIGSYIINDSLNCYKENMIRPFLFVFNAKENTREEAKEFFYKSPRVNEISLSSDLDMAYWEWINNSDIVPTLFKNS